jgi:hypothetical protein
MSLANVDIALVVQNNTNADQTFLIMSSTVNPASTSINAVTEYTWDITAFTFTNETQIILQYRAIGIATYTNYTASLNASNLTSVINALNNLNIGTFATYISGGFTYISTYNDSYVFGQLNIVNSSANATINWTMTEYNSGGVIIDSNFVVSRVSDGFVYLSQTTAGSGSFSVPANTQLVLTPSSDTTQGVTSFWGIYTNATLSGLVNDTLTTISSGSITLLKNNGVMQFNASPNFTVLAGGIYNVIVGSSNPTGVIPMNFNLENIGAAKSIFTAIINASNVSGITGIFLFGGGAVTTGTTTAELVGSNTVILTDSIDAITLNSIVDAVTLTPITYLINSGQGTTNVNISVTLTSTNIINGIKVSIT